MRKNSLKVIPLVILLLLTVVTASAHSEGLMVLVRGRAESLDGDYVRNDIVVSGYIHVDSTETDVKVKVVVELEGPDGSTSKKLTLYGTGDGVHHIIIDYEVAFIDFATTKGMYEITVTAEYDGIEDTGTHQFDPPGGGAGPPRR